MKIITSLAVLAGLAALPSVGWAADQTILGRSLIVKNPGAPEKRKISSTAKEVASPNTVVGDPTLSGAVLTVIANGMSPSTQVFNLPQGTSLGGKTFWRQSGPARFKYKDGGGEQGPVKTVIIGKTPSGNFTVKVSIKGKNGAVNVVPPNPGSDGAVTLELVGGDRYCLQFGADGTVINDGSALFKVRRPTIQDCPGGAVTTTTSTTTTTTLSSPSAAFLD